MPNFFHTTLHPAMYHGHKAKPPFFEGWYFKLIDQSEKWRFAIIPGVILGEDAHAFIQVLDGVSGLSEYHRYDIQDFHASKQEFHVWIGANEFTQDRISLDIDQLVAQDSVGDQREPSRIHLGRIKGELKFQRVTPWPVTMSSPGIMGWYAWVPFMECYHGVVSLDHNIIGELTFDNQTIDFSQGSGYIEKDWGKSFPDAWVWFQTNHFQVAGTCLTGSVATIPWLGGAFRGFIVGLWHDRQLYRFATYNRSNIESLEIQPDRIDWVIKNKAFRLSMRAMRAEGGLLKGPTRLEMDKRVVETLNAQVEVRLETSDGQVLFEGIGRHAGLEVHNTISLTGNKT